MVCTVIAPLVVSQMAAPHMRLMLEQPEGNKKPLDSSDCVCSTIPYSLLYACALCSDRKDLQISFGQYSGQLDCENTAPVGQYSGPTFGVDIPSWAYQQLTASDTFDVTKAKEVSGNSPPGIASPSPASTQVPQPTTQPSQEFPSSSGQPMTSSSPGGAPGAVNASSTNPLETGSPTATLGDGASSGEYTGAGASSTDRHPPPSGHEAVSAELGVTGSHVASPSSPGATFATSSPSALGATSSASRVGPIVGGVIGGIVIVILALVVALLLLRRRREHRYRQKQAELAQAAFEWDKRPGAYLTPASMGPDALEPATATTDDGASEAETLHGDDEFIEKKSALRGAHRYD
ncbi:hypothetical protein PYCCODRAFT_474053 [Trametes coccinea BRFM310]|uniref:Uncharacterized protein n=1 Tax=Trametes coccinea (strain BRFM310) TaxID=1353009 RepID=A0A1Y2ING9_TRAC3|nr:hypothetical protein PYCCODRAFT_474053 [Trametes coccinea BRFM310]